MGEPWVGHGPNCEFNVLTHQVTYLVSSLAFLSAGSSKMANGWRQDLSLKLRHPLKYLQEGFVLICTTISWRRGNRKLSHQLAPSLNAGWTPAQEAGP